MNLAYIQARAGSKRFPRKAMALWNGKPMILDAIEKAKASGVFDTIAVTSDDPEILEIAGRAGVLPLYRLPENATDMATDDDVAREVLSYFPDSDIVCKLYPCIPLLDTQVLRESISWLVYHSGTHRGIYGVDSNFVDSGSFYMFRNDSYKKYGTISLADFPWSRKVLDVCQDINTPEDLEIAKKKAGLID